MRMSLVTSMEELQEGDHLISEEVYKEIAVLILSRTHPEWSRLTQRALDGVVRCANCNGLEEAHPFPYCTTFSPPRK